ncbi:MAG: LD-carboxypeptidase [Salinibacter sp.]
MRRPRPLRPGDPVAVVAPASAPRDSDRYREGLARLRELYNVRTAWTPGPPHGYLSGPDPERAAALNEAVADPALRALFCVRGGYGSLRLLAHLDWAQAREHPTLLVGYSDITALHLAYHRRAGWTGVSGPVVTEWATLDEKTLRPFRRLVEGGTPSLGGETARPMREGSATGPLLGGNLSVLSRLIGTSYAPAWEGAILVLEDVAEAPYRVDRMLAHLEHAGILEAVAGVVLGDFGTGADDSDPPSLSLETVFADYLGDRPYPVATHLRYGHLLPRCSLPTGSAVRLTVSSDTVRFAAAEPVVES